VAAAMKRCKHLGCRQAGVKSCECFGAYVVRRPRYVVWATLAHREKPWAVGREVRPGCLKVAAMRNRSGLPMPSPIGSPMAISEPPLSL
jgi:hypothetical protein